MSHTTQLPHAAGATPGELLEPAIRSLVLALAPRAPERKSAQLVGHCPAETAGTHCWKVTNPDPTASHDFYFVVTQVRSGEMVLLSQVIAIAEGKLHHIVRQTMYQKTLSLTFIRTMKDKYGSYGPVEVSKTRARTHYAESQELFAGNQVLLAVYDARGALLEDYRPLDSYAFPELAPSAPPAARGAEADPALTIRLLDIAGPGDGPGLYFDSFAGLEDDLEVDNGVCYGRKGCDELPVARDSARAAEAPAARPPGIYCETLEHHGNPSLVIALWWMQPLEGAPRFLFGDYCTQITREQLEQHVFVRRRKSWFRTKTKVTEIRKQLLVDGVLCRAIP